MIYLIAILLYRIIYITMHKTRKRIKGKGKKRNCGCSKLFFGGKWSRKYKKSINCKKPKGFSQKQYCKYPKT
jgi:hypothetical protein